MTGADTVVLGTLYILTILLPLHFAFYLGRARETEKVKRMIRNYYLNRKGWK